MNAPVYTPNAEDLRRQFPDLADGIHAQLSDLWVRPRPDAAETLASNLDGARRLILAYRERLLAEGEGHGR